MERLVVLLLIAIMASCANPLNQDDESSKSTSVVTEDTLPTVVFVGDSRVEMMPSNLFIDDYTVTNLGVGGTTSQFSLKVLSLITERYDAIVISVGINDSTLNIPYSTTVTVLEQCIKRAKMLSDNVYVTTIPGCCLPSTKLTAEQVTTMSMAAYAVNMHLASLTTKTGVTLIDLSKTLRSGMSAFLNPVYSDGSGIHYNDAGYAKLHDLYVNRIEVTE